MDERPETHGGDHDLVCHHCGGTEFTQRRAQLNTAVLTFFDLDWLNATADVFVCDRCGYLHWFLNPKLLLADGPLDCLACGAPIPDGQTECPVCGWTWEAQETSEEEGE
jgi:predicted nucleic-acid-binding Zn-ribbon protein